MEKSRENAGRISKGKQANLKVYIPSWAKKFYKDGIDDVYDFEGLPPTIGGKLEIGYPNIEPTDTENESPTAKEIIDIAKKYDGLLIGYVVTELREDARIAVTGLEIKVNDNVARKLKEELADRDIGPDESMRVRRRRGVMWRFWWD